MSDPCGSSSSDEDEPTSPGCCSKCKKVVEGPYFLFKNRLYHPRCFTCAGCCKYIFQNRYSLHGLKPYCSTCYSLGSETSGCGGCGAAVEVGGVEVGGGLFHEGCISCRACAQPIRPTHTYLKTKDNSVLHIACLRCSKCQKPLSKDYVDDKTDLFCPVCASKNCSENLCWDCDLPFTETDKSVVVMGRKELHKKCFLCSQCRVQVYAEQAHFRGNQMFCPKCFQQLCLT